MNSEGPKPSAPLDGDRREGSADEAVEVHFPLTPDEEGWPPVSTEPIWARPLGDDRYRLLNVPFFALGVSGGDVIEATRGDDGLRQFAGVVQASGHSTIRIIVADPSAVEELAEQILRRGCHVEASFIPALVAIDVPAEEDYAVLKAWLDDLEAAELLDYEEANVAPGHL